MTSGDFAITAPGDAGKTVAPAADAPEAVTAVLPTDAAPAPAGVLPPLPSLSPEEAALKFETMPEAPEQHPLLEDQEPMRFVWSKRWPFLALVPASSVAEPDVDARPVSDETDEAAPDSEQTVVSDVPPVPPLPPLPTQEAEPNLAEPQRSETAALEDPGAVDPLVLDEAPGRDTAIDADSAPVESDSIEPQFIEPEFVEPGDADRAVSDDSRADDAALSTAIAAAALVAAPAPPVTEEELVSDDAVDAASADVDAALVNELLDEIEAADETAAADAVKVDPSTSPVVLRISGLSRRFGDTVAVDGIDLDVHEGSFYGIVGPNGAGKTTTLSMVTGLLRPDSGSISVHGIDVWADPDTAKRSIGVLPDRLRLFDRLTGAQLLYYAGILRGLDGGTVRSRVKDLAKAFGLEDALNRLVTDYSAGMTKKVALAAAMIHSPRLLVLDEPFESVDPVSAANVIEILQKYVAHGGTVVLSSHGMDLIQRVCDHVAIIVNGQVLASGAVDDVRGNGTLEDRFVELAGGRKAAEGMEWLHSFSD